MRLLFVFLLSAIRGVSVAADCGYNPADIVFLLDSSVSVGTRDFEKQKNFVANFVDNCDIGPDNVQIGVVTFASTPHGYSNEPILTKQEANILHQQGIRVFAVGVGSGVEDAELYNIASAVKYVFQIQSFDAFDALQEELQNTACEVVTVPARPTPDTAITTAPLPDTTTARPRKECGSIRADIVFLLDSSVSVGKTDFEKQKNFVANFVDNFVIGPDNVQVGVVTFASAPHNEFSLNTFHKKDDVIIAILNIQYNFGGTRTDLALKYAREKSFSATIGDREGVTNILIVITDGYSNEPELTKQEASILHQQDIKVFAIGVGRGLDEDELFEIASAVKFVFQIQSFDAFDALQEELQNTACEVVTVAVTLTPRNAITTTTTVLTFSPHDTTTIRPRCGSYPADTVFLLDSSVSVGTTDFEKQKNFVANFVANFDIGPDNVQIGVVTFASMPRNEFSLNTFQNKNDVIIAILNIRYIFGGTRTDLALKFVRENSFSATSGDRKDITNILIVITDGYSKEPVLTKQEANILHQQGIRVFAVGVGTGVEDAELYNIASAVKYVFQIQSFDAFDALQEELQNAACEAVTQQVPVTERTTISRLSATALTGTKSSTTILPTMTTKPRSPSLPARPVSSTTVLKSTYDIATAVEKESLSPALTTNIPKTITKGVKADSPLNSYNEWPVSGHCRMNAWCTIDLVKPYFPQADQQGFAMKVTLENHAMGFYEVYWPFDQSTSTTVNNGANTIITLVTQPGVWISAGTQTYNFYLDFQNINNDCTDGSWPQGTCSGPFSLEESFTCENDEATISCSARPGTVLDVTYANYGRRSTQICVHETLPSIKTDCPQQLENALSVVKNACQGKTSCSLTAGNAVFGDTCPGTWKYLEIRYDCKPLTSKCTCSASGDPHYKTFDGQLIHFQGICTYRLAEVWHGDCGMIVNVKNIGSTGNPSVAFTRTVYITVDTDTIVIDQDRKLTRNGFQQAAPYNSDTYRIFRQGDFIVVENNCSMQALFDGRSTAKVKISAEDGLNATGICGDCNGVQDDFRLKNGTDVSGENNKYSLIGISHWDPGVDDIEAECKKEDDDVECADDVKQAIQSDEYCGYIRKSDGPFGECITLSNNIDPSIVDTYYEECEYDVCAYWGDAESQVCGALRTFLSYCYDIGAAAINFRTDTFCPAECGENKIYVTYLTTQHPTCKDPNPSQDIQYPPEESCLCADGFVLDNAEERCVPLEECGCATEDNYYAVGTRFLSEDCTTLFTCIMTVEGSELSGRDQPACDNGKCKAINGQRQCVCNEGFALEDGICKPEEPPSCKCSASGDPHYKTFDGQLIHFQGVCTYRLAEIWHDECGMIVNVKNIRSTTNPQVALTRTVYVIVGSDTITIDQGRKILRNGIKQTAPYDSADYRIFRSGSFIVIENNCSMQARFDGKTTAKVKINREDGLNATGICGNCNGVEDDFVLKNGTDVSNESNKYSLIGISHWVGGVNEEETECKKDDDELTCEENVKIAIESDNYCGYIRNLDGPFGECIGLANVVDPGAIDMYYEDCEYDVCAYWGDSDGQVCSALETFLSYCYDIGAGEINFRTESFCSDSCEENQMYVPFLTTPQPSCKDPNPSRNAQLSPEETCMCVEGFIFDNEDERCIPIAECGCITEDNYYAVNTSFLNEDCTKMSTCIMTDEGPMLSVKDLPACNNGECQVVDGQRECVCDENFVLIDRECRDRDCTIGATGEKITDGDSFTEDDNCTVCTCSAGRLTCNKDPCSCSHPSSEETIADGASYVDDDNCTVCTCSARSITCDSDPCKCINEVTGEVIDDRDSYVNDYGCSVCTCVAGNIKCDSNPSCTCVNEETNETITAGATFTKMNNCTVCECRSGRVMCDSSQCSCSYRRKTYGDGECFPAGDGCNTCTCSATLVTCSNRSCAQDTCEHDGQTYQQRETYMLDCNTCTCSGTTFTCTEDSCECDAKQLGECLVAKFKTSLVSVFDPEEYICENLPTLDECLSNRQLELCTDKLGSLSSLVESVSPVLTTQSQLFCDLVVTETNPKEIEHFKRAGQCLVDFAEVVSQWLLFPTCIQANASLNCIQKAMKEVSPESSHLLSMVTSAIETSLGTVCETNTCNLGTAERCLMEAQAVRNIPLYKDGTLFTTCRSMKQALSCVATHIESCDVDDREDENVLTALEEWLRLVDGLRGEYSDLETCSEPELSLPDIYDEAASSIIALMKKLKGESWTDENKMIGALQALRDWILSYQGVDKTLSGMELAVTKQKLKLIKQTYKAVLKKVNSYSITLSPDVQALLLELDSLQEQVDSMLKARISEFEMRVLTVRDTMKKLQDWTDDKCPNQSDDLEQIDPWFHMFVLFGSLLDNPYANKEQICKFIPKLEEAVEYMNENGAEVPEDVKESVVGSLEYAKLITSELCQEAPAEDPEEPECVPPPTEETRACNSVDAITTCATSANIIDARTKIMAASTDESLKEAACSAVRDILQCIHDRVKDCTEEDNMGSVPSVINSLYTLVNVPWLDCDLTLPPDPPVCEPEPLCDPMKAVETCFNIEGEVTDICSFTKDSVLPCLHLNLGLCKLSINMSVVQFWFNRFQDKHSNALEGCELETTSIFLEDVSRPLAECNVLFAEQLLTSLGIYNTFNEALCSSFHAHAACMMNFQLPFLMTYLLSRHEKFYSDFWKRSCTNFNPDMTNIDVSPPDLTGCDVEAGVFSIIKYINGFETLYGFQTYMEIYATDCSLERLASVETTLAVQFGDNCVTQKDSAVAYLRDVRDEYCPVDVPTAMGTCCVKCVEHCLKDLGTVGGIASLVSNVCGHLAYALDCVSMFSENCNTSQQAEIDSLLVYTQGFLGIMSDVCNLDAWCMDSAQDTTNPPLEPVQKAFCNASPQCSLVPEDCFNMYSTKEEICSNASEVTACIETKTLSCSDRQKVQLLPVITMYEDTVLENTCSIKPTSFDSLPADGYAACQQVLQQGNYGTTQGLCEALDGFVQCLHPDLTAEGVNPYERQALSVLQQFFINLYNEQCQQESVENQGTEGDTEVCPNLDSAKAALGNVVMLVSQIPLYPIADRETACSRGTSLFAAIDMALEGCSGKAVDDLRKVKDMLGRLIENIGVCQKVPFAVRICRLKEAVVCAGNLSLSYMMNLENKYVVCSQVIPTKVCVMMSTFGCETEDKDMVEHAFSETLQVVDAVCALQSPEPKKMCPIPGEELECSIEKALYCPRELQEMLNQDMPKLEEICPTIPAVISCVYRYTAGCNETEMEVINVVRERLHDVLDGHCPQVNCDVCGAYVCMAEVNMKEKGENFCGFFKEKKACVMNKTEHCGPEMKEDVMNKLEDLEREAAEYCVEEMNMCVDQFENIALSLLTYDGPLLGMVIEEDVLTGPANGDSTRNTDSTKTRTADTDTGTASAGQKCDSYVYENEPWYKDGLKEYLFHFVTMDSSFEFNIEISGWSVVRKKRATATVDTATATGVTTTTVTAQEIGNICVIKRPVPLALELHKLCSDLFVAWNCIEEKLVYVDEEIREALEGVLRTLLQSARQKCKVEPLQCHSCKKARNAAKCDAAPLETCDSDRQACYTKEYTGKKKSYVTKGCKKPKQCPDGKECKGKWCKKCCVGPVCNQGTIEPATNSTETPEVDLPSCTLTSQFACAVSFINKIRSKKMVDCRGRDFNSSLGHPIISWIQECQLSVTDKKCALSTRSVVRKLTVPVGQFNTDKRTVKPQKKQNKKDILLYFETVSCMSEASQDCVADDVFYEVFSLYSKSLVQSEPWTYCVNREQDVFCGLGTAITLYNAFNPYAEVETLCRLFNALRLQLRKQMDSGLCMEADLEAVLADLVLINSKLYSLCTLDGLECVVGGETYQSGKVFKADDNCNDCFCKDGRVNCTDLPHCRPQVIPSCPEDQVTPCFSDPCEGAACPNHLYATCSSFYCGGCHAQFIVDDNDVTSTCHDEEPTRCEEEMDVGSCDQERPAWYFNAESGMCEEFLFSGCGGNRNRFLSSDQCYQHCGVESELNQTCEMIQSQLIDIVAQYELLLAVVGQDSRCSFYVHFILPQIQYLLGKCHLPTRREEIQAAVVGTLLSGSLNFDASACETDGEMPTEGIELKPCVARATITTQCLEIDRTETGCGLRQAIYDCVAPLTSGCDGVVLSQISMEVKAKLDSIDVGEETCDLTLPEPSDSFTPLLTCLGNFSAEFVNGLSDYIKLHHTMKNMCTSITDFKTCVARISNLPAKLLVGEMVSMADKVYDWFVCEEFKEELPLFKGIQCYVCHDEQDNDACNQNVETCSMSQQSCQTTVRIDTNKANVLHITKRCFNPTANLATAKQWQTPGKSFSRYGCNQNLCNEGMLEPASGSGSGSGSGAGAGGGGGAGPSEPPTCLYQEASAFVEDLFTEMFALGFAHLNDIDAFCSNVETASTTVETFKVNCSEEMAARIDKIWSTFAMSVTYLCPQPLESTDDSQDLPCDWSKCVEPILPYLKAVHDVNTCPHYVKAKQCHTDMAPTCDQNQMTAIANFVLRVQNSIVGPDWCDLDLQTMICELDIVDPTTVCDVEGASDCTALNDANPFDEESVCRVVKNLEKCFKYYTDSCPPNTPGVGSAETAVYTIIESLTCTLEVNATWEPNTCSTQNSDTCHLSEAVQLAVDFVIDQRDKTDMNAVCTAAINKKTEVEEKLTGCNSVQMNIANVAMVQAAAIFDQCTISLDLDLEDYVTQEMICFRDFMSSIKTGVQDPSVGYPNFCNNTLDLVACLSPGEESMSLVYEIMKDHLSLMMEFYETCQMPETVPPAVDPPEAGCNYWRYAHCITNYGMEYLAGPLMTRTDKQQICMKSFSESIEVCAVHLEGCTQTYPEETLIEMLKELFNFISTKSTMCTEPEVPEIPDPCVPSVPITYASQLGLAVSMPIAENASLEQVCNSLDCTSEVLKKKLSSCPESVTGVAMSAWYDTVEHTEMFCKPQIDPPFEPELQMCIDVNYNPDRDCNLGEAISCSKALQRELFNPAGTEDRFCALQRKTVRCFIKHTNCLLVLSNAINPLLIELLDLLDGRCPDVFCPIVEQPEEEVCDLDLAYKKYSEFKMLLQDGEDICSMVTPTVDHIRVLTAQCKGTIKLLIDVMLDWIYQVSVEPCKPPEEPDVDMGDCLTQYKTLALQFLGGDMANTVVGNDTDTADENTDEQNNQNDDAIEMAIMGWVNDAERSIEDSMMAMCQELEASWSCVEAGLEAMEHSKKRQIYTLLLQAIKKVVEDKCRPNECYTCVGLDNNEDCNQQASCSCQAGQQMCYTKYVDGLYYKGCADEDMCADCHPSENCSCCHGRKCNKEEFVEDQVCDVEVAIDCAFSVLLTVVNVDEVAYSAVQSQLECVVNHTIGCVSESNSYLLVIAIEIIKMLETDGCVTSYGDPNCGIRGILALGHLMQTPFYSDFSLCGQYMATNENIEYIKEGDTMCTDEQIDLLDTSYEYLSDQLNGYCEVTDGPTCQVEDLFSTCMPELAGHDMTSCSVEMFTSFKDCTILSLANCSLEIKGGVYFTVKQTMKNIYDMCANDITVDFQAILGEIFQLDQYTEFFYEFITRVQTTMLQSYNFLEDACVHVDWLKEQVKDIEMTNPLIQMYVDGDVMSLVKGWEELCSDTSVTDEDIEEECSDIKLDVVLLLDTSGSVGTEQVGKVFNFAKSLINLMNIEEDKVRVGVIQFATNVIPIFTLKDCIKDKECMLNAIDNIVYEGGKTNTGEALELAVEQFFTKANGARPDAKNHIVTVTDGKTTVNPEKTVPAANYARQMNIHVSVAAINMTTDEQRLEIEGIADDKGSINHIEDFDSLDKIFKKIFIAQCRSVDNDAVANSVCDFSMLVTEMVEALSATRSVSATFSDTRAVLCSHIEEKLTAVTTASIECIVYQQKVLQFVQKLVMASSMTQCVSFSSLYMGDPTCNMEAASAVIADLAQFMIPIALDQEYICMKIKTSLQQLNRVVSGCPGKTAVIADLQFVSSIVLNSCPELTSELQCWGLAPADNTEDTPGDDFDQAGDVTGPAQCDMYTVLDIGVECLGQFSFDPLASFLDPCGGLLTAVAEVVACAIDKFIENECGPDLLSSLQEKLYDTTNPIGLALAGCSVDPENYPALELPDGYGVVEPQECEAEKVCNVTAVMACMEALTFDNDCGNWNDVKTCVFGSVVDCNEIEHFSALSYVRFSLRLQGFSDNCLSDMVWWRIESVDLPFIVCTNTLLMNISTAILTEEATLCSAYQAYMQCIDGATISPFMNSLGGGWFATLASVIQDYCNPASPSGCEGKTKIHGGCAANKKGQRYECDVPIKGEIISVSVHEKVSKDADCNWYDGEIPEDWTPDMGGVFTDGVFTYSGNTITVVGCRAVFKICYRDTEEPPSTCDGKTKTVGSCAANKEGERFECEVINVQEILNISIHNLVGKKEPCTFYDGELPLDWTGGPVYSISGNKIIVDDDCRAVFDICYIEVDNPVPEEDVVEVCDLEAALSCLHSFMIPALTGPALTQAGKHWLCNSFHGQLECLTETVMECLFSEKLWEIYHFTEMIVYTSGVCAQEPLICSPVLAVDCISSLGQQVTHYNPLVDDEEDVCLAIETTESCVEFMIYGCDHDTQLSVMDTYMNVRCIARDICAKPDTEENMEPVLDPPECVDPAVVGVSVGAGCHPLAAYGCLWDFKLTATHPYATTYLKKTCVAYSDMLQCVYKNSYQCPDTLRSLVNYFVDKAIMSASELGCETEVKSPCEEVVDCGVRAAETCIEEFRANLTAYREMNTVCLELQQVYSCIQVSIETCSDSAKEILDLDYNDLVAEVDIVCDKELTTCVLEYVDLTLSILKWKAEPEEDTETQKTGTQKTEKSTKSTKTEKSTKSTKSEKSTKSTKTPVPLDRTKELESFCLVFEAAWTCVTEKWSTLPDTTLQLVTLTYTAYHNIILSICHGPRTGVCPLLDGDFSDINECTIDDDCQDTNKKCCPAGDGHICVKPDTEDPVCLEAFVQASGNVFSLVNLLFTSANGKVTFCEMFTETVTLIQEDIELCIGTTKSTALVNILAITDTTFSLYCSVPPDPEPTCNIAAGMKCVTDYNIAIAQSPTDNNLKCSSFNTLELCVKNILKDCNSELDAEAISSLQLELSTVQDSLTCVDFPDVITSIMEDRILVSECDNGKELKFKLNQSPADLCSSGDTCTVQLSFQLTDENGPKCGKDKSRLKQVLMRNECIFTFDETIWDSWQTKTLVATMDGVIEKRNVIASLDVMAYLLVNGAVVQTKPVMEYTVVVKDCETKAQCKSVNDPHITTFDGEHFDSMDQGEFILYRHKAFPFEVRAFFVACGKTMSATCNCAAMIKCQDDVYVINRCYGEGDPRSKITPYINGEMCPGLRVFKKKGGKHFRFISPLGTKVDVKLEKSGKGKGKKAGLLNIFITPSGQDWGNTEGLCGIYDGNKANDLTHSDGTVTDIATVPTEQRLNDPDPVPRPDEFSESWKTKEATDYIVQGVPEDQLLPYPEPFCRTNANDQCVCDYEGFVSMCGEKLGKEITDSLAKSGGRRKKRAVGNPLDGMLVDLTLSPTIATFPTPSGITFTQAYDTCYNNLTLADYADVCKDLLDPDELSAQVSDCVNDIKYVDDLDTDFIRTAVEALRDRCVYIASVTNNETAIEIVSSVSCLNSCSQQGTCVDDTCECFTGYAGPDCSINIDAPPTGVALDNNLCVSTIASTCATVVVRGDNFVDNANISCHLTEVEVNENGISPTNRRTTIPADYENFEEVSCTVAQASTLPLHAVIVSISNNGQEASQSEQNLYIAHNPICWSCSITDTLQGTCTRKPATCVDDGKCYGPLEPKVGEPCYICDPGSSEIKYYPSASCPTTATEATTLSTTVAPPNQKAREINDATVIGLSSAVAVLVLIIIAVVVGILVLRHKRKQQEPDRRYISSRSSDESPEDKNEGFGSPVMFANYGYYSYPPRENPYAYQGYVTNSIPVVHSSSVPDNTARYVEYHRSSSPDHRHRHRSPDRRKKERDLRRSHTPPRDFNA